MKKGSIIALIVAGVLIFAGAILTVMGLSFAKGSQNESIVNQQEVWVPEPFESIHINTKDCDVSFVPYNGDADAQVVIREQERVNHSVYVEEGTLRIEMNDMRSWIDHIGILGIFGETEKMNITVYLPEAEYDSVYVRTATGDIQTPAPLKAKELQLRSDTGDIYCDDATAETLDCMTDTGDISVRGGTVDVVKLQSSTGNLSVMGVSGTQVSLQSSTGEVDGENVNVKMFTCTSSTGEVELGNVIAEELLQIRTTTGDVGIENCDAGRVDIETDTGDVEGHFLTPKWFSAISNTGNVDVPNTPEGGDCRIETDTGDIHFE